MESMTVACSTCGTSSPRGQKFCGECGTPLPLVCSACGSTVTATQKFCGECAAPLKPGPASTTPQGLSGEAASPPTQSPELRSVAATASRDAGSQPASPPPPPHDERRLVTALFCDLVGFTPLAEQLDPEDVRDLQAEYFRAMREQIERYGGTVQKYAGDAIVAVFGAPVVHEDDAERAVLCALGMQGAIAHVAVHAKGRWQVEPAIRVGVNSGEVVSGIWEIGGRIDLDVTGDAVNTAARLQTAADPGGVLVGAETMRLTRRRIHYGPKRDLVLKGKTGPVPAYVALGVREQVGERWEEGPRVSPLIGRERELVQLLDGWMRAQGGEGQLLTVVGESGVGKSRLIAETLERIAAGGANRIVRARCFSYGQEISLWLVVDLLRSLFLIREQDGPEEVRAKLAGALGTLLAGADETSRAEARDVLGEVLGLPPGGSMVAQAGPQVRRHALIRSLRLLLGTLSDRAPTVLVLEDLHWIDQVSEEVLKKILSDVPGLQLLILATHRPGRTAPWSEWGWTERLTLRPLRQEDVVLLAGAVLGGMELSPELEQYVAERAGGNPFFVEEMLRALEEAGGLVQRDGAMELAPGAAERLPSTLTEILLARLDRLEGQVRNVAQVASVIGRSFAVRLLARVMEHEQAALELPLMALQQAEIAFPRRGTDLEYVFKHASMREVAYHTLLAKRRRQLHLQTARAIATLYPADEYVEMIAYHYVKTDYHGEAVGWLERAGDRAAAVYATESALTHYRETLRRLQELAADPSTIARVEEKLGVTLYTAGRYDEALTALEQAAKTYQEESNLEEAGRVTARMGMAHRERGTVEEGIALVQPMIDLLARSGSSQALASLYIALASLSFLAGRYRDMQEAAGRAGEIARGIGDERLLGQAEERRASALLMLGRAEEALRMFEAAIPVIEAGGDLLVLWQALNNAAVACQRLGRVEENRRYTEQALGVVERTGNPDQTAFILANLGGLLSALGDWQRARGHLERAVALLGEERSANAATVLIILGELALREGEWDEAERALSEALAVARRTGERQVLEEAGALLGELEVLAGRPEEAITRLEELAAVDDAGLIVFPPLAWAQLEAGAVERAQEVAIEAIRRARAEEQRIHLPEALRLQGMILSRQGGIEEAERAFREGLEVARSLPLPYAEARILAQLGHLERQRGQLEQARRHLEEAQVIFRRLGARKDLEWTEQALTLAERAGN